MLASLPDRLQPKQRVGVFGALTASRFKSRTRQNTISNLSLVDY
ncbi:hypothetical protein [Hymenobacter translucens]|nr:hypothetical protein [Hymenobacter translucens]